MELIKKRSEIHFLWITIAIKGSNYLVEARINRNVFFIICLITRPTVNLFIQKLFSLVPEMKVIYEQGSNQLFD